MSQRRDFLKLAGAALASASGKAAAPDKKMIGIQVGAVSFVDEASSGARTERHAARQEGLRVHRVRLAVNGLFEPKYEGQVSVGGCNDRHT